MLKSKVVQVVLALILACAIGGFYGGYTEANKEIEVLKHKLEDSENQLTRLKDELKTIPELTQKVEKLENEVSPLYEKRDQLFEKLKKEKVVW